MVANTEPLQATPSGGHNIVRQPTSFIGREDDVRSIISLVAPGRIVTIAGPGEVGKTRLALEVGLETVPNWPDGVWIVDLSHLTDSELIPDALFEGIGATTSAAAPWDDALNHLRERAAVILFDNIELHLDAYARLLPELVKRCRSVGVLTTGQEPLNIGGETVHILAPLRTPTTDAGHADPVMIMQFSAVQMFSDRAHHALTTFSIDRDTADDVAWICDRLDGLPPAVQIAAARVKVLSVQEIAAGLNDRFTLLKSLDRTLPERQRTTHTLMDWSFQLLDDSERATLRRLTVLASSFSLDAAVVVVVAVVDDALDADAIGELVWSLVDRSLLVADFSDSSTRYRMLETIHAYARRLRAESGEGDTCAVRLGQWNLDAVGPWMSTNRTWVGVVGIELTNLRV